MKLIIRTATIQDALRIAPIIRREDLEEWIASAPLHASPSIAASLVLGTEKGEAWYAEEENGTPVAIGGLCVRNGFAAPWLMATPAIARHSKEALRWGRATLRRWRSSHGLRPANVVSARHVGAVRFIKACGYDILCAFCRGGERFYLFGAGYV